MKRIMSWIACVMVLSCVFAAGQSLGDVARKQKSQPKPKATKVYTNEDIPSVTPAPGPASSTRDNAAGRSSAKSETKDSETPMDEQKKLDEEYKSRIAEAKKKVADLEHEIDLLEREHKLRAAVFYSDAGNRLRDDKNWTDQERRYNADVAARRQDLQAAKEKLEMLRDQARKAGVSRALD